VSVEDLPRLDRPSPAAARAGDTDRVDRALRCFRKAELSRRSKPGARYYAADLTVRTLAMCGGYTLVITGSTAVGTAGAVLFALVCVSMVGSWFHDAVHGNVRGSRLKVEAILRAGSAPIGLGPRWWFHKHVRLHHRYTGNPAFDPDIQFGHLGRVTREQPWQPLHRAQHLYMWFLLPFATLNMLKPSEPWTVRRAAFAAALGRQRRGWGWLLLADKYVPHLAVWLPVFLLQPAYRAWSAYLVFHLVAGTFISLITQVQHNTDLAEHGPSSGAAEPLVSQVRRSTDVGHRKDFWYWLSGGTTYHVVHHVAPTLTFPELPGATARLQRALNDTGEQIRVHPGMWAAVRSHARLIRALSLVPQPEGREAR